MAVFIYKGYDAKGKSITGTRDADNARAMKALLRKEGVFLTSLQESTLSKKQGSSSTPLISKRVKVSTQELAVATRQLATLIGAGIPLVQSLTGLVDQIDNEGFKSVWADIRQRVNEGTGFGDSLGAHPKVFSGLYINMVRAGETSGAMDIVLERLAEFTEGQSELRNKLIGTMIYPIIMVVMAGLVMTALFILVIPKIAVIFESQKATLPLPTEILIGLSHIASNFWHLILILCFAIVWGFKRFISSDYGRPKWDYFILNAPIFGVLVRMVAISRFSKTLSTLLASGVPLLTAFDIVKNVLQNHVLMAVIDDVRDAVKEGENIAEPLKRSGEFPPIVTHMISIGEQAGQLEEMLGSIAKSYESQISARLQAMTAMLEPLMLVLMGVGVLIVVMAILLPMMQITDFA